MCTEKLAILQYFTYCFKLSNQYYTTYDTVTTSIRREKFLVFENSRENHRLTYLKYRHMANTHLYQPRKE
jgi:hypothetical protein